MRTTLDVDEAILREAERQAHRQGKTLAALVEEGLRSVIRPPLTIPASPGAMTDALDADDPFFNALEEIRSLGRLPAARRHVNLD